MEYRIQSTEFFSKEQSIPFIVRVLKRIVMEQPDGVKTQKILAAKYVHTCIYNKLKQRTFGAFLLSACTFVLTYFLLCSYEQYSSFECTKETVGFELVLSLYLDGHFFDCYSCFVWESYSEIL